MVTLGALDLQSGFVVAVILLAVFFAERLGGSGQLAQRGFQVAVGLAATFLVLSSTTAFVRAPELPEDLKESGFEGVIVTGDFESGAGGDEQERAELAENFARETAQNASEVATIHTGLGILLIAAGLVALRRWRVLPFGLVLGGLLLLLIGGSQGTGGSSLSFIDLLYGTGRSFASAGEVHDAIRFAVLLVGTALLMAFGFLRWEGTESGTAATSPSAADSPVGTA